MDADGNAVPSPTSSDGPGGIGFEDIGGGLDPEQVPEGEFVAVRSCDACTDFPAEPLLDPDVTAAQISGFTPGGGAGPCITEPYTIIEAGVTRPTLFPANWLRPRFRFSGGGLTRVTLQAERQVNDLVAYTTGDEWRLPPEIWELLAQTTWGEPITVRIANSLGESTSMFEIAPVNAGGGMVFWSSITNTPGIDPLTQQYTTTLYGFTVGAEAVIKTLAPPDVEQVIYASNGSLKPMEFSAPQGQARCVGCHTSTPDGAAVAFTDHWPWNVAVSNIAEEVGASPDYVTPLGRALLNLPWQGISTFSRDDWMLGGNRVMVTSMGPRNMLLPTYTPTPFNTLGDVYQSQNSNKGLDQLVWLDLMAPGAAPVGANGQATEELAQAIATGKGTLWGVIARSGDARGAVAPDWSHDGTRIAYTSTDSALDGHVGGGGVEGTSTPTGLDIYTVPYNGGAGGVAAPLAGAADPVAGEYYPDFSADDRFVAFNRVATVARGALPPSTLPNSPQTTAPDYVFYRSDAEITLVSSAGGTPLRIAANDSPSCEGNNPLGQLNSWPKWSPIVRTVEGSRYYFLIFSSARNAPFNLNVQGVADKRASQLYMTAVVERPDGSIETYPAVYLWNQVNLASGAGADATVSELLTNNLTPAWDEFQVPVVQVQVDIIR